MNRYQQLFKELQKEKANKPSDVNDHIVIFDGLNAFIRAFGATPSTNEDGAHIGGITGFLYSIGKVVRDFKPSRCIVVFDGRGGSSRRRKIHGDYKANRANKTRLRRHDHLQFQTIEDEQEAMRWQFSRLVSYLDNLPITFLAIDQIEADDTIAYISNLYQDVSKQITIVSTDRDFYQLISPVTRVWSPIKKKMYDADALYAEFGVYPVNYVMYRAFTGDTSDNITGITGFGPKTILKTFPELNENQLFTLEQLEQKCKLLSESKSHVKVLDNMHILQRNCELMDLQLLNIPATLTSQIRGIVNQPIPLLNKPEFQRLFMEDKMWSTMKNLPDWLHNTWLSLNAFAMQTQQN